MGSLNQNIHNIVNRSLKILKFDTATHNIPEIKYTSLESNRKKYEVEMSQLHVVDQDPDQAQYYQEAGDSKNSHQQF